MFLIGIFGSGCKIVPVCDTTVVKCPCCGHFTSLSLHQSYDYLHAFFLPLFKFHSQYFATCPHCAATYSLPGELGKQYLSGMSTPLSPADLQLLQQGVRSCPHCGEAAPPSHSYCGKCGARL